jgi:thioredoxin reductase (NADPH)
VAASVTLLLNGAPLVAEFPPEVTVRPEKIDAILGEQKVTGVQLSGGDVVELAGVFVALGVAGSTALARKIGAAVENDRIVTDEKMQTTVPGLYAAGDCTGGLLQVAKAVYEGALAGTEAAKALRKG